MGLLDWFQFFRGLEWDVCLLAKGWFNEGDWKLDFAARCTLGNYMTIEHSTPQTLRTTTVRKLHLGIFPGLGLWRHRERLRRFVRSRASKLVVCVSDAGRQRLVGEYGFPSGRVVTVRNGVDSEQFIRDTASGERWRRRHGIPVGTLVFGAVGRLDPIKRFDIALSGFQMLLSESPRVDAWLVLIGEGPDKQALEDRARRLAPRARIMFLPYCEHPWEPMSGIDVFVMPSVMEGLPLALLESMACGCCPIATAIGGIPEVVSSPELGWLVPAGDIEAFGAAMIDAASRTPGERTAMGKRAREFVRTGFNASVQFDLLVDQIESFDVASTVHGQRASRQQLLMNQS
jgi:glycosyltransferase involved in cell wall biosynthesis